MKKLFPLFMAIFLLFVGSVPKIAFAEDEPKATQVNTISGNLFDKSKQADFETKHYEIDTAPHQDEEKGVFSKAWGYMFGDDSMGKDIQRKINGVGQWIVALMFQFSVWLTRILLFLVEQSFSLDIIDSVADKLGEAMQNIAGIGSKPEFENQGLLPSILPMTCILSVIYFVYLFFVKRQMTKGVSEIFKVVCVIAGILVYIANAPMILKGMNTISSEISLQVLSKTTGTLEGNPGQSKEAAITNVKKQMWDLMVDRPYMYLQYGQDSAEKIGQDRINTLLDTSPGKDRVEMVKKDVKEHKNFMMTNDSVGERMIFSVVYYIVNTFAGLPTLGLCLMIVACQLWFMVMSIIGPIAMAFALIPKNRRVLISWAEQWLKPLLIKIFLSLIVIILFSIAGLLYKLPEAGASGYIMTMILQILVFVLCYLFRDNIKAAFRKSRVAYQSYANMEQLAGKTKDGYNQTMDTLNSGLHKAKDMFMGAVSSVDDEFSTSSANGNSRSQHVEMGEETEKNEEEKPQYASIGNDADQDGKTKVSLEKESNTEEQQQEDADQDDGQEERPSMEEDEEVVVSTEEETEEYQEDQEEVHPEGLASLEGMEEDEAQENPELSEVEDIEQQEQDDASEYETVQEEGSAEDLATLGENEEGKTQENPELSEVEDIEQQEQDDASEYETVQEEGSAEDLVTLGENEEGKAQQNPELSEVEGMEKLEQDDPSEYETENEEGNGTELATTEGSAEDSQQEHAEVSEVEAPEQPEQDDVAEYETEQQEGTSNKIETSVASTGQDVAQLDETQTPIQPISQEATTEGENGFVPGESYEKELTSTKGLETGSSVGNISTKELGGNQFQSVNPSGNALTSGLVHEGEMQDTPIESSGDLAMTSTDSLVTSGSMPSHSMSRNGLEGQKITGQTIAEGQEIRGQDSSQDVAQVTGANSQGNTTSLPMTGTSNTVSQIESAREEVAVSEEMMVDATQERTELETIAEHDESDMK